MEQISIGSNLYVPAEKFGFRPVYNCGLKGYLHKQGHHVKNWKLRYFVLDSDGLRYYTDETMNQLRGEWKLNNSSIIRMKESSVDDRENIIELISSRMSGEKDTLYLSARVGEEQKNWFQAINEKIKDGLIEVNQPDLWEKISIDFYIKVSFYSEEPENRSVTVEDGNIIDILDAESAPRVAFPSKGLTKYPYYTFVMLDMDYPNRSDFNRRIFLLYLRVNVSDSDAIGEDVINYQRPNYTDASLHRIFFVVFPQSALINVSSISHYIQRDYFRPIEFVSRLGLQAPVSIEGCYFTNKSIGNSPAVEMSSSSSIREISPLQKKTSKKFKYYSQHAKRASLTLDNAVKSTSQVSTTSSEKTFPSTPDSVSSINSSALSSPLGEVSQITQLTDDAMFDDYLALPILPGDISRDTSCASSATKESRRVSFVSSSISLANDSSSGTPTKLVSALKRPGSKKLQSKKTVSFHANEVKYLIATIPDEAEIDVYDAEDVPDYDVGGGNSNSSRQTPPIRDLSPSYRHSPKSISANTSRMVSGMTDNISEDPLVQNRSPLSSSERASSFHLGTTLASQVGIVHEPSMQISSSTTQKKQSPQVISPGFETSLSNKWKDTLQSVSSDYTALCKIFGVSNHNIFAGEILNKKFSSDFTFKNSFVWIQVYPLRIYWAKSMGDRDIAGKSKYLSLDISNNEAVLPEDQSDQDSASCRGTVTTVSRIDLSLLLSTKEGQYLQLKSTNAERIHEWSEVISKILSGQSTL